MKEVEHDDLTILTAGELLDFVATIPRDTPVVVRCIKENQQNHHICFSYQESKINRETVRLMEIIY